MKIGMQELIVVLIVVVLIFGPTQLPKLTKMFGKSIKSFRDGLADEDTSEISEENRPQNSQKDMAGRDTKATNEES